MKAEAKMSSVKCQVSRSLSSLITHHPPLTSHHSPVTTRHSCPTDGRRASRVTPRRIGAGCHSSGFTMIELLVSLSILLLLFGLLFLPMLTGMNLFYQGKARTETQATARNALEQMQREISRAMFVYVNTDYINTSASTTPLAVPSRIDFILPQTDTNGIVTPLQPQDAYISYYVRLPDTSKASDAEDSDGNGIRDALTATSGAQPNLHVLYRAEYSPLSASPWAWRTYADANAVDTTFDLLSNSVTDSAGRSHTSMTPLQDTDVVGISFQLRHRNNDDDAPVEAVAVSIKVARFDVARGGGVTSQLKQDIHLPNVVE